MIKETTEKSLSYRQPLTVTNVIIHRNGVSVAICPKCHKAIDRDYQAFCDSCGQKLKWTAMRKMTVRYI
jgi:predicted amidophosphoribosyltransferase